MTVCLFLLSGYSILFFCVPCINTCTNRVLNVCVCVCVCVPTVTILMQPAVAMPTSQSGHVTSDSLTTLRARVQQARVKADRVFDKSVSDGVRAGVRPSVAGGRSDDDDCGVVGVVIVIVVVVVLVAVAAHIAWLLLSKLLFLALLLI